MDPIFIALVVQALISAGLCAFVASEKGRDSESWAVLGLLFGILGLIAVAGLPLARKGTCHYCKEPVYSDASACPHCQREIEPQDISLIETVNKSQQREVESQKIENEPQQREMSLQNKQANIKLAWIIALVIVLVVVLIIVTSTVQ